MVVDPPKTPSPVWEAVEALKPEWRLVIMLHYQEGYSINDMADMIGIPTGTVKTRMKFGRDRLRTLLSKE